MTILFTHPAKADTKTFTMFADHVYHCLGLIKQTTPSPIPSFKSMNYENI